MHLGGPNLLVHQSGASNTSVSPTIVLPRPLAREGKHAYLECDVELSQHKEAHYETSYSAEELEDRKEMHMHEGYLVLELHMQKLKTPKDPEEKKRKRNETFASSPPAPRPAPHQR